MEFLSSCDSIDITVWMHHMDADNTHIEKKLNGDDTCRFKQIQEATPNKTKAEWAITLYLTNHASKTNKTFGSLLKKQRTL